ncbi:MAG: ABC-2 transporter permease [Burkholderiales bacterium]|nr:ABC-2 transporter permease [Burkholderiales bacterium]
MSTFAANFPAFRALVLAELRLYFSSRRTLVMNILAPVLIGAFFGYVTNPKDQTAPHVPVAVVDLDNGAMTKAIVDAMSKDASLNVTLTDEADARKLVSEGKLRAAIILPEKFGATAANALFVPGDRPKITIIEDPSKAMEVSLVQGLLTQHVMQSVSAQAFSPSSLSAETVAGWRKGLADAGDGVSPDTRSALGSLFDSMERLRADQQKVAAATPAPTASTATPAGATPNAGGLRLPFSIEKQSAVGTRDAKYNGYAHSFAGMSVQFILFLGIDLGVALLLARRMGLWKRLRAAPLSRATLIASRMTSGAVVATVLMIAIFAAAIAIFGVRIRGSIAGFALITVTFAIMTASFGLFIAAVGKTPEATRGLAIVATLIMVMLGGAWVPSFIFPQWLQTASLVVPTRWAVDGLDAMTWRGLGFDAALAPSAVLLGFAALFALLALWRFRWDE